MIDPHKDGVGDRVRKVKGYAFDGEIRALFTTKSSEIRVVVESEVIPGLLHIFSPNQLERKP